MSIATQSGDDGSTTLAGGRSRLSKAALRVETYGNIDELGAALGLARSLCADALLAARTESIQRELFRVGAALSTPPEAPAPPTPHVSPHMVEALTAQVHELESLPGMLSDWSVPGAHPAAAAFDLARTVCRRAERSIVALRDSGSPVSADVLAYVNRLSDLLWLYSRKLEKDAGVDSRLRKNGDGPNFSKAW
jgi:cob(I)alamin adenosyltransferase